MFAHFLYSKVICPPRFHVGFSIELPLASPWRLPQPTVCKWNYFPSCSSRDLQLSLSRIEAILATPRRFKLFILQCSVHFLYIIRKSNFFSTHKTICFKPQNISKKFLRLCLKHDLFLCAYHILSNQVPKRTSRSCLILLAFQHITPKTSRRSWFRKKLSERTTIHSCSKILRRATKFQPHMSLQKPSLTIISVALHGMFRNCFFPSRTPLAKYTMSLETPPILPRLWRKIREAP